jgi:hypothetical protein
MEGEGTTEQRKINKIFNNRKEERTPQIKCDLPQRDF